MICTAVPFAYFYSEASYVEDDDVPRSKKIASALKYTSVLVFVVIVLLLVGLFLHTDHIRDLIVPSSTEKLLVHQQVSPSWPARRLLQMESLTETSSTLPALSSLKTVSSSILAAVSSGASSEVSSEVSTVGIPRQQDSVALAYEYLEQILHSNSS